MNWKEKIFSVEGFFVTFLIAVSVSWLITMTGPKLTVDDAEACADYAEKKSPNNEAQWMTIYKTCLELTK